MTAGWSCLEVGAGNGSVSQWLAQKAGQTGHVSAATSTRAYLTAAPCQPRRSPSRRDPGPAGDGYDLVWGRAILHHIPQHIEVPGRLVDAVRPGGVILLEEPDFHPVLATDSPALRGFWAGFLAWAANQGIDYFVGRHLAPLLAGHGVEEIAARSETILFNGGSLPVRYLSLTMPELEKPILASGLVGPATWAEAMILLDNRQFWTCQISGATGRRPLRLCTR